MTRGFSRHLGGLSPRRAWAAVTRCLPASPDTVPKATAPAALPARALGVRLAPAGFLSSYSRPPRFPSYSGARLVTKPLSRMVTVWNRRATEASRLQIRQLRGR